MLVAAEKIERGIDAIRAILQTPGVVGFDVETTIAKARDREVCTIQVAHADGRVAIEQVWPHGAAALRSAFRDCRATVVAHNAIFEQECLIRAGISIPVECTLIAARVLRGRMEGNKAKRTSWNLAALAKRELGIEDVDKTIRDRDWREPLDDAAFGYIVDDAVLAMLLWARLAADFDGLSWKGYTCLRDALPAIAETNMHGLPFDKDRHRALCVSLASDIEGLEFELGLLCGEAIGNVGSTQQVAQWMLDLMLASLPAEERTPVMFSAIFQQLTGQTWPLTETGKLKLDKTTLEYRIKHLSEIAPDVANFLIRRLQWSKAAKMYQAFGPKLAAHVDERGYITSSMRPHGAQTSRTSASNPNLQQQPADPEFRRNYMAKPGRRLVICDYGQVELRVGCIIANDQSMQEVFAAGEDIHQATATKIKRLLTGDQTAEATPAERKKAKAPSFASLYGAQAPAIALNSGLPMHEAEELLDAWLAAYPGIAHYRDTAHEIAKTRGGVRLVSGQWIGLSSDTRPAQTINCPVQGSSASVMYLAMTRVHNAILAARQYGADIWLAASVHDEIILDCAEDDASIAKELLETEMIAALLQYFPQAKDLGMATLADASIVDSWADKA